MKKFLSTLHKEWTIFKENNPKNKEISVNLEGKPITDINLLFLSLYAKNRNLKGNFTSLETIKGANYNVLTFAETIPCIAYTINSKTLCFKDDLIRVIPQIDLENPLPYLEEIKIKLKNFYLSGFSENHNKTEMVELPIPHFSYTKKEIVANEYLTTDIDTSLSLNKLNKNTYYQTSHINTEDILTDFFVNMYVNGIASMDFISDISIVNILQTASKASQRAVEIKENIYKSTIKQK